MTTDDKVVHAFPGANPLPENILEVKRERTIYCGHASILIDEHERSVQCAKCGCVLDPFDFLRSNGLHIQRAWDNHHRAQTLVTELNERISKLEREEKRLKAVVKRLHDKTDVKLDLRRPL